MCDTTKCIIDDNTNDPHLEIGMAHKGDKDGGRWEKRTPGRFEGVVSCVLCSRGRTEKERHLALQDAFQHLVFPDRHPLGDLFAAVFFFPKVETIPYSQFKQNLIEGNVTKLVIGPENINGTIKGKGTTREQDFTTIRVDDPNLVKELDEHKVRYSGLYESKLIGTIISWILPLAIMLLIWRFAMKKMGPGAG